MTSFNDNDGVPSTGNKFILKNVLREEWKYDGMVVTDWASATEMITHGFCKDAADDCKKSHLMQESIWNMVSGAFFWQLGKSGERE